jgi:hypothetical protein
MKDPVQAADGQTYQRAAIQQWLARPGARRRSPITNLPLQHTQLTPNYAIKADVDDWLERHGGRA